MNIQQAIITNHLCNFSCWEAREKICRCECGGKNHGILNTKDGVKPPRRSRINGVAYTLLAVAENNLHKLARGINEQSGPYKEEKITAYDGKLLHYRYFYHDNDPNAPCRVKTATKAQLSKWVELSAYKNIPGWKSVQLAWLKDGIVLSNENQELVNELQEGIELT